MNARLRTRRRWPLLLLLAVYACLLWRPALGQPRGATQPARAYAFLGQYFRPLGTNSARPYRLDARLLPVVSPYAAHFDLRRVMQADFLTNNQFNTTIRVDTMLTEADFEAMRGQLAAWQRQPRWSARRLRAAGVAVLKPRIQPSLFPAFTTYRVFPPLFSRNGRLALFYVENHCGLDCGGGQVNLLRQHPDGTWYFVLGVPIFVS